MRQKFGAAVIASMIGVAGLTMAAQQGHGTPKVRKIAERDMAEKVDGKDMRVTTVEVTLEPGQASMPHRHPGPVFGYVLEGQYEWGINADPVKTLKVGDTFYEPTGTLHRVSHNPSTTAKTRILAILLHPRDVEQLVIPETKK